jgi:hypothetical protein
MGKYFSHENTIEHVRNGHAFHYDIDQAAIGFKATKDGDPLDIFLADSNANSLFGFADTIVYRGMLERIAPGDPSKAVNLLIAETMQAANWASELIGGLMFVCLKKYFSKEQGLPAEEVMTIEDAPPSNAVRIPFFVELS